MSFRIRLRTVLAVFAVVAVAASGCASLDEWQRKAIFQTAAAAAWFPDADPGDIESFDLRHENGDNVHGWYARADERDAPTVLYLHGARRNLAGSRSRVERWRSMGFNVLAIDYRGFGRSTSLLPTEESALADATLAMRELERREADPRKRFLYGYSLGGAFVIALAAEHDGLAGVVVEASFTSIADIVRESKWGWVPGISLLVTQKFDSAARIGRVNEPLLFIHGTADRVVPHTMSDKLLAEAVAVRPEYKRVVKIDGARHYGSLFMGGEQYVSAVREFTRTASEAAILGAGISTTTAP